MIGSNNCQGIKYIVHGKNKISNSFCVPNTNVA